MLSGTFLSGLVTVEMCASSPNELHNPPKSDLSASALGKNSLTDYKLLDYTFYSRDLQVHQPGLQQCYFVRLNHLVRCTDSDKGWFILLRESRTWLTLFCSWDDCSDKPSILEDRPGEGWTSLDTLINSDVLSTWSLKLLFCV